MQPGRWPVVTRALLVIAAFAAAVLAAMGKGPVSWAARDTLWLLLLALQVFLLVLEKRRLPLGDLDSPLGVILFVMTIFSCVTAAWLLERTLGWR